MKVYFFLGVNVKGRGLLKKKAMLKSNVDFCTTLIGAPSAPINRHI
ncbi:hypothetical protein KP78_07960 [Jeotgalibacillus soli]|uniref:Uncharacterized protein n=1 Tax=Jeotgalibacillus soli TaxID=889306 RepID=A0A0C2VZD8_9BACL|nr:hypothetical protein KP78_07960 [Jeotgalibacillus soli]